MRKNLLGFSFPLLILLAACNPASPTMVMVLVTNTPDPNVIQVTKTPNPDATPSTAPTTVVESATSSPVALTLNPTSVPATQQNNPPSNPPTNVPPQASPTNNPCPPETHAPLYIAQQDFEHGFMFWISTQKTIWVLIDDPNNPAQGTWQSYPDTFQDGEPETDPTLNPPSANLYQPRRGFGKLWRNTPDLKSQLGWGTTPEFNLTTSYSYIPNPGNTVNANATCNQLPGTHVLVSLSRQTFEIMEPDKGQWPGRWRRSG